MPVWAPRATKRVRQLPLRPEGRERAAGRVSLVEFGSARGHSEVRVSEEREEVGRDEKIENPEMVILCSGVLGRV